MYREICCLLITCITALPAVGQTTSMPAYWRYAHPNASLLAGIDVEAISGSAFGQRIKREFEQSGFRAVASSQGLDFLQEVDRVFVSAPASPKHKAGAKADSTPAVAALQGRFDLAKIRKTILGKGGVRSAYRGVELLRPDKEASDMALALVSGHVLLMGDPASVRAAIDHHASANPEVAASSLYQRATGLTASHDVWFVSETSPAELSAEVSPQAQIFAEVENFEGAVSFREGFGLAVHLNTGSPESATRLGAGLQGLMQLAAMGTARQPGTEELLRKLQVTSEAEQIRVSLYYTQQELERGMDQFKASLRGGGEQALASIPLRPSVKGESSWTVAPVEPDPEPEPAGPLVVKIYNAEGGTKEVSLGGKQ